MVLEWLRRQDPIFDEQLRTYLFKDGDIMASKPRQRGARASGIAGSATEAWDRRSSPDEVAP